MEFIDSLVLSSTPKETYEDQLPIGIYKWANEHFKHGLDNLYYPDLYILPISIEGQIELERLYSEYHIGRYGAYECNFTYEGELYLAVLVNND